MRTSIPLPANPPAHQLDCARRVVRLLFEWTGLSEILAGSPAVIVGNGNWISFTVDRSVSMQALLGLSDPNGKPSFIADVMSPSRRVRSRTSPSLHLTELGTGANGNVIGHVDAHYWVRNPLGHAREFLSRRTTEPSVLWRRVQPVTQTSFGGNSASLL